VATICQSAVFSLAMAPHAVSLSGSNLRLMSLVFLRRSLDKLWAAGPSNREAAATE
jgi:hypothetical protein